MIPEYQKLIQNNALVYNLHRGGYSAEVVAVNLGGEIEALKARLLELESIAPRKITHNGFTYVWHCPNELIPETKL